MDDNRNNNFKNMALFAGIAGIGAAGIYLASKFLGSSDEPTENRERRLEWNPRPEIRMKKYVRIVTEPDVCEVAVNELRIQCEELNVLGFDCEWKTVGHLRNPIALLQLSSSKGLCILFRLCILRPVPAELQELLEDRTIIKVGVAPEDDAKKLLSDFGINVKSTLDLRHLASYCGDEPVSLARMSYKHLGIQMEQSLSVRVSNWELPQLTKEQEEYAANDVYVALELFKYFSDKIGARVKEVCKRYLNVEFKTTPGTAGSAWYPD